METPTSISKRVQPRKHAPTPKMQDRKKSLFTMTRSPEHSPNSDDSDLGILSPIYLSATSSESSGDENNSPIHGTRSTSAKKKLQRIAKRFSDVSKYEMIARQLPIVEETDEDEMNIFSGVISPKDLSRCLSAPIVLLTPCDANTGQKEQKISFKKASQSIDNSKTPVQMDSDAPKQRVEEKERRARASLIFNDGGAIPTNLFYASSTTTQSDSKPVIAPLKNHNSLQNNVGVKIKATGRSGYHRHHHGTKRKEINRGVFHKIRKAKPKKKLSKQQIYYAAMKIVKDNEKKKATGADENSSENDVRKRKQQFERLRKILRNATNSENKKSHYDGNDDADESDLNDTHCEDEVDNIVNYLRTDGDKDEPPKAGKIFKSKKEKKARYQVNQNLAVNIDNGKIQMDKPLNQQRPKKRKLRSLFDDDYDAEVEEVHDEVVSLLKDLERDVFPSTPTKGSTRPTSSKKDPVDSPTTHKITSLTSEIADWNPVSDTGVTLKPSTITSVPGISKLPSDSPLKTADNTSATKLFPVFYQNQSASTSSPSAKQPAMKKAKTTATDWKGFGDNQLQIDAGQKEFGAIECKQCGFIYTQHVPEDEVLHNEFHNSAHILNFKGWEKENKVLDVPEWGVGGRIIAVSHVDSKPKLNKAQEVLKLADLELGFAQIPIGLQSIFYLACNHNQIIGICVAQPQREANKLISDFGIDFCSPEFYNVKCGISRIWVSAKHRRRGIGTKLIQAVQGHFVYGYRLGTEEIAFSAPTEMGKAFAEKLTGKKDFYVYQA